jgi:hypothetical protein
MNLIQFLNLITYFNKTRMSPHVGPVVVVVFPAEEKVEQEVPGAPQPQVVSCLTQLLSKASDSRMSPDLPRGTG